MQKGNDATDYDIVIGGAANDKVFNTVELYFDNLIDKKEAIRRLRYEKPNLQMCLRTQTVLDEYLHYEGSEQIWQPIRFCCKKNMPGSLSDFRKRKICLSMKPWNFSIVLLFILYSVKGYQIYIVWAMSIWQKNWFLSMKKHDIQMNRASIYLIEGG